MATAALVDKDLDIGREILRALAKGRIEVTVAFWAYVPKAANGSFSLPHRWWILRVRRRLTRKS
jgi:hypothetical protein